MTVDSWQTQTPGNTSKKSFTMRKQIWVYFTAVTASFATKYQFSDTEKKRKKKKKLCKTGHWLYGKLTYTALYH